MELQRSCVEMWEPDNLVFRTPPDRSHSSGKSLIMGQNTSSHLRPWEKQDSMIWRNQCWTLFPGYYQEWNLDCETWWWEHHALEMFISSRKFFRSKSRLLIEQETCSRALRTLDTIFNMIQRAMSNLKMWMWKAYGINLRSLQTGKNCSGKLL